MHLGSYPKDVSKAASKYMQAKSVTSSNAILRVSMAMRDTPYMECHMRKTFLTCKFGVTTTLLQCENTSYYSYSYITYSYAADIWSCRLSSYIDRALLDL